MGFSILSALIIHRQLRADPQIGLVGTTWKQSNFDLNQLPTSIKFLIGLRLPAGTWSLCLQDRARRRVTWPRMREPTLRLYAG